ncbi:TPA: hypothetical protein ACXM6N_003120 [Serratia marcescens]
MKVIVFLLFVFVGIFFLPDTFIYIFVKRFIPISGDGEYAMNNFEMTVLLIKVLLCAVGTAALLTLFRTR